MSRARPFLLFALGMLGCEPREQDVGGKAEGAEAALGDKLGPACAIRAEAPIDEWTPAFIPNTDCSCDTEALDCWSLWRGRIRAIEGDRVRLEFKKVDESETRANITAWVVDADDDLNCLILNGPPEIGVGQASAGRVQFELTVSPFTAAELREDGLRRGLALITDGADTPTVRSWYQPTPLWVAVDCSSADSGP